MSGEIPGWSLKRVVEAILFASQRPVSIKDLQGILKSAAETDKEDSALLRSPGSRNRHFAP
jgi:chromosome segregation and condensation protein ScpB